MAAAWTATIAELEEALTKAAFVECSASQEKSLGWVPPRGKANGALVEAVDRQWLVKLMVETKAVPANVLKRRLDERLGEIEMQTGRKPGRKESKEIKEDLKQALLPMAFSKQSSVLAWIDASAGLVMLDVASSGKSDEVVTALVKAVDGLGLTLLQTTRSAASVMAEWLSSGEVPAGFVIGRECELKATDESQAVVRYARHPLEIEEVRQHIAAGKMPTKLALLWDDKLQFVLTDTLQIKKIGFEDSVFEGQDDKGDDGFDANVAISTGELRRLIPDLVTALGGEQGPAGIAAVPAPA